MDDAVQFCCEGSSNSLELHFCKSNTFSMPFLLPSQFTRFYAGHGEVGEGQLMVRESCVNGMRNV